MAIGTTAAILGSAAIGAGTSLIGGSMQSKAAKQSAQAMQQASDRSAETQRYIFDTARSDNRVRQQAGDSATQMMARIMGLNLGPQQAQQPAGGFNALAAYPGLGGRMGLMGEGALTSGVTGQTQTLGNALSPQGGQPQAQASPFNFTEWVRSTPQYDFNFNEGMRALNLAAGNRGQLNSGGAARDAIRFGQNFGDGIAGDQWNRLAGMAGMGQTASSQNQQAGMNFANNMTAINQNNANALSSSYQNSANAYTNAIGGLGGAAIWGLGKLGK